ncbi:unnamed protein product [Rhizophagus irregularis]|nr:unnamed protein product [Rhizophagus irregularis]
MEKQHVLELFKLKGKNPQIECNFRMSDNEFPKTLDPERIRYLKSLNPELESSLGPKCDLNLPYICDICLHRIGEGGFGAVFSVIKSSLEEEDKDDKTRKKVYHYRTGPCTVALKKLKGSSSVRFLSFVRDHTRSSTLFIMRFAPQGDLRRYLLRNFDNLLLPNKLGDIYSLGILLWELACGIIAFADRSHDVNLILDICDGLRPQTSHYSPIVYNDIIKMCWDPDPSKRPSASEILISIERLCAFRRPKDDSRHPNTEYQIECGGHFFKNNSGFFEPNGYDLIKYSDSEIHQQLKLAHRACRIYIKMK